MQVKWNIRGQGRTEPLATESSGGASFVIKKLEIGSGNKDGPMSLE